jgi:tetratricopeptide (TPR) repeat protein
VGLLSFFFSKKIFKKLTRVLGKVDTFDALMIFKKKSMHFFKTLFARLSSRVHKNKPHDIPQYNEEKHVDTIEDIIRTRSSSSKRLESDWDDTVEIDDEESKTTMIKKRKLLEKIIYDALWLRKEGKLDEYEKKIIEWLAIDDDDMDLNKLLADLYFTMSNHKKALPILKKIVEIDPKDHKAIWQIAEVYLTSGDFDVAELLIQKAIDINPTNPKYYISMVELMYNTDRKNDAIIEMEKVIKLRPTNAAYLLTLADLYQEINDLDNAKKYYFRVLEYEPSNEKAKKKLREITME